MEAPLKAWLPIFVTLKPVKDVKFVDIKQPAPKVVKLGHVTDVILLFLNVHLSRLTQFVISKPPVKLHP